MNKVLISGLAAMTLALSACTSGGGATSSTGAPVKQGGGKSSPLVGNPAPDFSVARANGEGTIKLADLKGKVVLVDFWATWCKPCAKSFPKYQELYVKYKDKLEVVGLSEDDEKDGIDAFGKTYGVKFPLGWDEGKSVAGKYNPENMPTAFIVDKEGVIRFAHFGYEDGDEKQIEQELKELF